MSPDLTERSSNVHWTNERTNEFDANNFACEQWLIIIGTALFRFLSFKNHQDLAKCTFVRCGFPLMAPYFFLSFIKSIPIHKPHKNYLCVPLFSQTCWQTLYHVWTVHLIHAEIIQRHLNSTPLLFDSNTPASGEPRGWCQPPKLHVYKTHRFFKQTPF